MGSIRHDGKAGTGCSSSSNCRKSFDDQATRASYVGGAPNPVTARLLAHSLMHSAQGPAGHRGRAGRGPTMQDPRFAVPTALPRASTGAAPTDAGEPATAAP